LGLERGVALPRRRRRSHEKLQKCLLVRGEARQHRQQTPERLAMVSSPDRKIPAMREPQIGHRDRRCCERYPWDGNELELAVRGAEKPLNERPLRIGTPELIANRVGRPANFD
jgi:hypothetical protein